jgi:hypothetical protein
MQIRQGWAARYNFVAPESSEIFLIRHGPVSENLSSPQMRPTNRR